MTRLNNKEDKKKYSKIRPATNLANAYNAVLSDLEDRNIFKAYYVERSDSPVDEIKTTLLLSRTPIKILFAGQPRSGKTTELVRLINELQDQCFTIYYSAFRDMEPADIKYQDLLILTAIKLSEEAIKEGVEFSPDLTKLLSDWFAQVSGEVLESKVETKAKGLSLGAKLKYLVGELGIGFKTDAATRTEVRRRLEPRVGDIIDNIDMLAATIKNKTGKDPLLIIDDLEKVDMAVAEEIFYGHAQTLERPNLRTIYTFPMAMTYTAKGRLVASQLSNPIHLPNILTRLRGGAEEEGLDLLRQIVLRRMKESLFAPDTLNYLLKTSNGVLGDLFSILAGACITALSQKRSRISWNDVDTHFKLLIDQFRRVIREPYYPALVQVCKEKRTDNNEKLWDMLHILAVLEYRDEEGIFYDVHPAVASLLREKKLL